MMDKSCKIAVGIDWAGWYLKFAQELDKYQSQGLNFSYSLINLEGVDWIEQIIPYDFLIWNPNYMGLRLASHFKEKIFAIQNVLNKTVLPNFNSVWHFESKVAESYLFERYKIKTPKTFITFDYTQAKSEAELTKMPVVLKKSEGAASVNVELIGSRKKLIRKIDDTFSNQLRRDTQSRLSKPQFILENLSKRRFWYWLRRKITFKQAGDGVIYWQEFIPNNPKDLRITVIGDRFVYWFWRNNRARDFRASGSGLINYEPIPPTEIIEYCLKINRELGFDSMCYDILFTEDSFVINEMSYSYIDKYLFNAPGYYERYSNGTLALKNDHIWPQQLWVRWMLVKLGYLD